MATMPKTFLKSFLIIVIREATIGWVGEVVSVRVLWVLVLGRRDQD